MSIDLLQVLDLRAEPDEMATADVTLWVPRTRLLSHKRCHKNCNTAVGRLARFFETSAEFWMSIQSRYALETVSDDLSGTLDKIEPLKRAG